MPINLPDFPAFSALVALESVVRTGSFAAAGRELNVSQVAVNKKVAELEAWLGVSLVVRQRPRIAVKEDARTIASAVQSDTQRIRDVLDCVRRDRKNLGRVTVFASTSFLRFWLSPRLHRFDALHPSAELHLVSSNKCNRFDPNECDAAIVYSDTGTYGFNAFSMMNREHVVPVASPSYLESRQSGRDSLDFSQDTLLCLDNADEVRVDWDFWFDVTNAPGRKGQQRIYFNDYVLALSAAIDGRGLAMGYRQIIGSTLDSGRLVEVGSRPVETPGAYRLLVSDKPVSGNASAVNAFRDWITSEAKNTDACLDPVT